MDVFNLKSKFDLIDEYWTPKLVGELNGQAVKIAKLKGEFIWHNHKNEDELFYIVNGQLIIDTPEGKKYLEEGDMMIIPKGIDHKPIAEEEVWVMLFEPMETKHTGDVIHELTKTKIEKI